jgi:acyl-CoA synthetase (AMP-forming)/AMP-acid ligase II
VWGGWLLLGGADRRGGGGGGGGAPPPPDWGEAVVAVVALRDGATATAPDLIAHCQARVGRWEVPKHVELVAELPKGATAKVQKHEIRDWFRAEPSRLPWYATAATA